MDRQEEDPIGGPETHQSRPQQRPALEIEGLARFLCRQSHGLLLALGDGKTGQIEHGQFDLSRLLD